MSSQNPDEYLRYLTTHFQVGQQRTAPYKQFTFLDPKNSEVIKGPFPPQRGKVLWERSNLFQTLGTPHVVTIKSFEVKEDGSIYFRFPNVDPYPHQEKIIIDRWTSLPLRVIERDAHSPLTKLSLYLQDHSPLFSTGWFFTEYYDRIRYPDLPIIGTLLLGLCHLYILNVGDMVTANILIDQNIHKLYIIDYEETRASEDSEIFYFKKPPAKKVKWELGVQRYYPLLIPYLQKLYEYPLLQEGEIRKRLDSCIQKLNSIILGSSFPQGFSKEIGHSEIVKNTSDTVLNYDRDGGMLSVPEFHKNNVYYHGKIYPSKRYKLRHTVKKSEFQPIMAGPSVPQPSSHQSSVSGLEQYFSTKRAPIYKGPTAGGVTPSGYSTSLMKSALQKAIRRNNLPEAFYAGFELFSFRFIEDAKGLITNLYNRLAVISCEDIGPANLGLAVDVVKTVLIENKNKQHDPVNLAAMIQGLAQSSHTRMMSHLWGSYANPQKYHLLRAAGLPVDDYQGQNFEQILFQFDHYLSVGDFRAVTWVGYYLAIDTKHRPQIPLTNIPGTSRKTKNTDVWLWQIISKYLDPTTLGVLAEAYFTISENRPFLMTAILTIIGKDSYSPSNLPQLENLWRTTYPEFLENLLHCNYDYKVSEEAIDMHTAEGKRLGKTRTDFTSTGALVVNQSDKYYNNILHTIYNQ